MPEFNLISALEQLLHESINHFEKKNPDYGGPLTLLITLISSVVLSSYHPKNKSMALFTIPELLLGVVGVPVISFADAAVLYDTCANGRAREIEILKNNEKSY